MKSWIRNSTRTLTEHLEDLCDQQVSVAAKRNRPVPAINEFWQAVRGSKDGESGLISRGCIVRRIQLLKHGHSIRIRLAPPCVEPSRRLLRAHPTERLIKISIETSLMWDLVDPLLHIERDQVETSDLGKWKDKFTIRNSFFRIMRRSLHILGELHNRHARVSCELPSNALELLQMVNIRSSTAKRDQQVLWLGLKKVPLDLMTTCLSSNLSIQ